MWRDEIEDSAAVNIQELTAVKKTQSFSLVGWWKAGDWNGRVEVHEIEESAPTPTNSSFSRGGNGMVLIEREWLNSLIGWITWLPS